MSIRTEVDYVENLSASALTDIKELAAELEKINDGNESLELSYILSLTYTLVDNIQEISEKLY